MGNTNLPLRSDVYLDDLLFGVLAFFDTNKDQDISADEAIPFARGVRRRLINKGIIADTVTMDDVKGVL